MRISNIEFTLKIPVKVDKADGNVVQYPKKDIADACKSAEDLPLVYIDSQGKEKIIGIAKDINWNETDNCIETKGHIWHGGTCETLDEHLAENIVKGIHLYTIGICAE